MSLLFAMLISGSVLLSAAPGTEVAYEIEEERNVVYGEAVGYWTESPDGPKGKASFLFKKRGTPSPLDLKLDLYLPEADGRESRPLLLMMHGGAYFVGQKDELGQQEWCRYFASLGYVAASIDYRMGYHLKKADITRAENDAYEDAEKALAYLLGRQDLRIDKDQVYLAGTSAGAAIALLLAYDTAGKDRGCRVRAVANLWGYVHDLGLLSNESVPILSFQSERDPVVPYREGYSLNARTMTEKAFGTFAVHEKAASLGIRCEHYPCQEKRHKLHLDNKGVLTPRFLEIRDRMAAFFAECGKD